MRQLLKLFAFCVLAQTGFAQNFNLIPINNQALKIEHTLIEQTFQTVLIDGVEHISFDKTYPITSKIADSPSIPLFAESVILPNTGAVSYSVEHDGYIEYSNVNVAPSKGSIKRNVDPSTLPYTFGTTYQQDAFYPSTLANVNDPFILRNTRGLNIQITPFQYNPVTKTLRVYKNVRVSVEVDENTLGVNEINSNSTKDNAAFHNVYNNLYLNYSNTRYTPLGEEGEMLIISADEFTDEMEPFVVWKTQSGIKTTMVDMSTVGSTDTDIKTYIENFYNTNPELTYVLLVGDHAEVPSHTYGSSGWESLWSDSYYGQLLGGSNDFYPEVFVGRFSGSNASDITTQVNRVLEYEKDPAGGDWMTNAIGIASNEGSGYGDDGEADWEHARNNRTKLLNFGYNTVYEFYDGSQGGDDAVGNPSPANIVTAVNDGVGLINYTGHGAQNVCVTGNFGSPQINTSTNNGKYPFVVSVACNNGTFTSGTCISEAWAWATNAGSPTGAINACGSTILMAWAEPMQTQDEMTEIISEAYANNKKVTTGGIFYNAQMSMLETYSSSYTAIEVMQTWVMFGDPSTIYRNKETMDMTVTHLSNVPLGTSSLDVQCDVDDVKITVVQNEEIIGQGISSGGNVVITFSALTSNAPLTVTGVKQNYDPYQGPVQVGNGPLSTDENEITSIKVFPNPASDKLVVNWDNSFEAQKVTITDLTGKEVVNANVIGKLQTNFDVSALKAGVYLLSVSNLEVEKTIRVIIK